MGMIDFYDLSGSPPCRAVRVTANLLGLELKTHHVDLSKQENKTPEFLKMNPFHTVPVINDNGFILYESNAIMVYLVNKYAPDSDLYPKDPQKRALVDQWLCVANGNVFAAAVAVLHTTLYTGEEPTEAEVAKAKDSLDILDGILATRPYVVGSEFTLADISVATSLTLYEMCSYDTSAYSNIAKYIARVRDKLSPMYAEVNDSPVADFKKLIEEIRAKKRTA